ncbi:MAG: nucleotide-binding protein, partial [Acidobacteria bacterium]|nr:nucleotide-binding protein [Acidobacteriota bacterium]
MTNKASNEKNEDIDDTCIPKVFIGSSSKAKDIAEIVGKYLNESGKIKAIVWNKVFKITETYIEQLQRILDEYDFAILVITKDNQDEKESKVRQNVLFELGLFMGRLGRHKAIMLCDEDQKVILPSDLEGIHRQTFSSVGDQTSSEYLEKPCSEILEYILDPYEDDISVFKFWKASCNQIRKALKKAPKHAIIKIIQTWLPDIEDFIEELAILLTDKKKQFKFRILLIDYDSNIKDDKEFDLLNARLKCRTGQKRAHAIEKIKDSINQFINLKEDIDKTPSQEPLDLEIHQY